MRLSFIFLFLQLWGNVEALENACSQLPDVPHAHVSEDTKKAEYQGGDEIHFTCDTGYISGPTIKYICSSTGEGWLAVNRISCYLKPCVLPDDTPNGYYQIIQGEDFVFGTTIKYFCNEGYQMASKDDTRTCLLDKWTNHLPICEPLSCDPPLADELVTVNNYQENDGPILPDRFLTFSCDVPGKRLNGSSVLICGKDGQWDNPFPSCEDIACEVNVMQPHLNVAGLPPGTEKIKIGHKLRFQCDDQYTMDGSGELECLPTGKWNAAFPSCYQKCKLTGLSNKVNAHGPGFQLRKGQKISFDCFNPREVLRGSPLVECLADGQWSDPLPTCEVPLGCKKPPPLADGDTVEPFRYRYSHGERVQYSCQNLYSMEGEPYKTCSDGKWIGQMRCLKPCTVDRRAMNAHNIAFRNTYGDKLYAPHKDHLTFICIGQRSPVGILNMRQQCIDGVMHLPTCQ